MGAKTLPQDASLRKCLSGKITKEKLNVCISIAEKNATSGLVWLSIIASTSPFIGLFGTVISILETFSGLGNGSNASLGVIAPAISEALVATGAGIFVAIPAYTFNLLIKRKAYELMGTIEREADVLLSMKEEA
nr:MotA/TolQ/ExbB proton channel family protein [Campylobacter mucosalis]